MKQIIFFLDGRKVQLIPLDSMGALIFLSLN